MRVSEAASLIAEAVEAEGLLLVHDQMLPSATALIAGEPILGSWWSHPLANLIYNALGVIEDRYATCKLIRHKLTLVAPRLWPDLASIGESKLAWQLDGLSTFELALLDRIESASNPVPLDRPELRSAGRRLEERLLAPGEEIHTEAGHHLKALLTWRAWMESRGVEETTPPRPEPAMARFEQIVEEWRPGRHLLPWPALWLPS